MTGQFLGNYVADKCLTDARNYSHLAAVGAGLGGATAKPVGQWLSKFMDPIRKPVIGSQLSEETVIYTNQRLAQSFVEGAAVGFSEKGGFVVDDYFIR